MKIFVALTVLLLAANPSGAQVLLNGGFENPQSNSPQFSPPSHWSSSEFDVDVIPNTAGGKQTPYGSQYVDLGPGAAISQTVTGFTAGDTYVLGADFANESNVAGYPVTFTLSVAGAATASSTLTTSIDNFGAYGDTSDFSFESNVLVFTATSTGSATITLASTGINTGAGLAIDNVSLYGPAHISDPSAPEPSTYAMLLAGLSALAFLVRRKISFQF